MILQPGGNKTSFRAMARARYGQKGAFTSGSIASVEVSCHHLFALACEKPLQLLELWGVV